MVEKLRKVGRALKLILPWLMLALIVSGAVFYGWNQNKEIRKLQKELKVVRGLVVYSAGGMEEDLNSLEFRINTVEEEIGSLEAEVGSSTSPSVLPYDDLWEAIRDLRHRIRMLEITTSF